MHELSIALSILDIASEESERRGGVLIKTVHMKLGGLSGVVKGALESAYELARESSPFPESNLLIEEMPIVVYCESCQSEQPIESIQMMCCPKCGTPTANVVSGRELEITAMEIIELNRSDCSTISKPNVVV